MLWIAIAALPVPVLIAIAFVAAYTDQDGSSTLRPRGWSRSFRRRAWR